MWSKIPLPLHVISGLIELSLVAVQVHIYKITFSSADGRKFSGVLP